jgi:hypothetical protein
MRPSELLFFAFGISLGIVGTHLNTPDQKRPCINNFFEYYTYQHWQEELVDEDTTEDQKLYHDAILKIFSDSGDLIRHGTVDYVVPSFCEVEEGLFGPILWYKEK